MAAHQYASNINVKGTGTVIRINGVQINIDKDDCHSTISIDGKHIKTDQLQDRNDSVNSIKAELSRKEKELEEVKEQLKE